jgi:hypothetical protein
MARPRNVHVVGNGAGGWRVTRARRTVSNHRLQRRAVAAGVRMARRKGVELVIHARNGRVRSKDTYGTEGRARDTEH